MVAVVVNLTFYEREVIAKLVDNGKYESEKEFIQKAVKELIKKELEQLEGKEDDSI